MFKRINLFYIICFAGFLMGFENGGLQYILLKMARDFELNSTTMATIVSVQFIALTIAPAVMGTVADAVNKKWITVIFSGTFAAGAAICCFADSIVMIYIGMAVIGFSFGTLETVTSAALVDAYPQKSGKYISVMQSFLSIGAVSSPLIISLLMRDHGISWRILFGICTVAYLVSAVLFIGAKFEKHFTDNESVSVQKKINMKDAVLMAAIAGVFIYIFMENGLVYFIDTFLDVTMEATQYTAVTLSAFWLAMAASRMFAGHLQQYKAGIIPACLLISAILLVALKMVTSCNAAIIIFTLLGAFFGPIWPFTVSVAVERYPAYSARITGSMVVAGGIGGIIAPVMMGMISDALGVRVVFWALAVLAGAGALISLKYFNVARN